MFGSQLINQSKNNLSTSMLFDLIWPLRRSPLPKLEKGFSWKLFALRWWRHRISCRGFWGSSPFAIIGRMCRRTATFCVSVIYDRVVIFYFSISFHPSSCWLSLINSCSAPAVWFWDRSGLMGFHIKVIGESLLALYCVKSCKTHKPHRALIPAVYLIEFCSSSTDPPAVQRLRPHESWCR